jgi:hypothetical protein
VRGFTKPQNDHASVAKINTQLKPEGIALLRVWKPNPDPNSGVKLQRFPEIRGRDRAERCDVVMTMMMAESAGILDLGTANDGSGT